MKLKVLWLAAYPYELVVGPTKSRPHPVPWITSLAEALKDKIDLTIASFSWRIDNNIELKKDNISFVFIKIPDPITENISYKLLKIYCYRKWLEKNLKNYDIVHINGTEYQFGSAINKMVDVPIVYSIQGLISETYPYKPEKFSITYFGWRIGSFFEKRELKRFSNFICRTHWDTSVVRKYNKDATIYKNWELMRPNFYNSYGGFDSFDSYNLLYVGGINRIKGIYEILLAFNKLYIIDDRFRLTICGYGYEKQLKSIIHKLKLKIPTECIVFNGFTSSDQLAMLFKNSFVLVHPTYIDNSPNSISEAQLFGLPVIASDVGGVSSLIDNNVTGLLVKRYDFQGIVDSVIKLKNDKNLYLSIATESRLLASSRHSISNVTSNLLYIYKQVIKNYDI